MQWIQSRYDYLFRSTRGLALVAIALVALVTAIWGTLSGPMAELGIKDVTVRILGIDLQPAEREGRIIMLYHTIAMAVVAIEVYFITDLLPMKKSERTSINATITAGYILAMFFGLGFAYFGHNYLFHGVFLFGQSLVFFSGVLLAVALWPWRKEYRNPDPSYAHTRGGIDLERVAFFIMAVATLGSATFGAATGSFWGNGQEAFLAEDLIREPHKNALELAVIGHLHIMLTLIGIAITLVIGRWFDFKGLLHKIAMPLMIFGTIVITLGAWAVVPYEAIAHTIIYVGSVFVLLAGLMLVIFAWSKMIRDGIAGQGSKKAGFFQKLRALVRDPLRFGSTWQMVFMNFTVSGVGIFMAVKLDEIFRVWPFGEERIVLTGHWHILSGLIATIILFYFADLAGLRGKARQWFGWLVILGSDLAFGAVTVFEMKRLFVEEWQQQPVVDLSMLLNEIGLGIVLIALAAFLFWRLVDLFVKNGRWSQELAESGSQEAQPDEVRTMFPRKTTRPAASTTSKAALK
jgi:hypothetical protein